MKIPEKPHLNSYEAALTDEQRGAFRALLLSGITLAQARQKAPPWPGGPEQGQQPSIASLGRIRLRLRIEERVTRIEEAAVARRVTRELLRRLVKKTDQETVLDEAMTLRMQNITEGNKVNKEQIENASPSFSSLTSVKKEGIVYFLAREFGGVQPGKNGHGAHDSPRVQDRLSMKQPRTGPVSDEFSRAFALPTGKALD